MYLHYLVKTKQLTAVRSVEPVVRNLRRKWFIFLIFQLLSICLLEHFKQSSGRKSFTF